ncbi:hypothetical protein ABZP36_004555 [Zizania latifolia]
MILGFARGGLRPSHGGGPCPERDRFGGFRDGPSGVEELQARPKEEEELAEAEQRQPSSTGSPRRHPQARAELRPRRDRTRRGCGDEARLRVSAAGAARDRGVLGRRPLRLLLHRLRHLRSCVVR